MYKIKKLNGERLTTDLSFPPSPIPSLILSRLFAVASPHSTTIPSMIKQILGEHFAFIPPMDTLSSVPTHSHSSCQLPT